MLSDSGIPLLKNDDILNCFVQMKIPGFKKNIEYMSSFAFKKILRKFLEFFAGKAFLEIYQPKVSAIEYLTYPELHEESTLFITEYRYLSEIIFKSSMENLFIFDFIKNNPEKIKKIFSGIINFARFKEKEILFLKKFGDINQKISFSSFEISTGLKFYKKKVLFLSNNYGKKNLAEKYEKKKKKSLNFFFWQNFFYRNEKKKKIVFDVLLYLSRIKFQDTFNISRKNNFCYKLKKKNFFLYDQVKSSKKYRKCDIRIFETIQFYKKFSGFCLLKIVQIKENFTKLKKKISKIFSAINFFIQYSEFQLTFLKNTYCLTEEKTVFFTNLYTLRNQKKTFAEKKKSFKKINNYIYKNPLFILGSYKKNKKFKREFKIQSRKIYFNKFIFDFSFFILGVLPYFS